MGLDELVPPDPGAEDRKEIDERVIINRIGNIFPARFHDCREREDGGLVRADKRFERFIFVAQYYICLYRYEDWSYNTSESRRQKAVKCTLNELKERDEEGDDGNGINHRKLLQSLKSGYNAPAEGAEELDLLDDHLYQLATYYIQKEAHA